MAGAKVSLAVKMPIVAAATIMIGTLPLHSLAAQTEEIPLEAALADYAARRGLQLAYRTELARGTRVKAVEPGLEADEELRRLLADTGLQAERIGSNTLTIRARSDISSRPEGGSEGGVLRERGAADDAQALEEIIVTAQKRRESVLEVPISMSVLGESELAAKRVERLEDYILTIPNATFVQYGYFNPSFSLRGVSNIVGGNFDPIAVTVDDIAFGITYTGVINSARFFDVERIEVLRGPQGTLTGTNSLGGTINIITAKPDPEVFSFKGVTDFSRFNTQLVQGTMNLPLNETTALRTTVYSTRSDGAVKNLGPGGGDSGYDSYGARAALRWMPSDQLTVDVALAYEDQRNGLDNMMYLDRNLGDPGSVATAEALAELGGDYRDDALGFIESVGVNGGRVSYDTPEQHNIENWLGSLHVSYALDTHTIDLLYGHLDHRLTDKVDIDLSEFALYRRAATRSAVSDGVELRVTSRYAGPINWLAGVTYHKEENPFESYAETGDGSAAGRYGFWYRLESQQELLSYAAFTNLFWDITPRLHLSAGVRVTRTEAKDGSLFGGEAAVPLGDFPLITGELTETSPRIALNFDLADQVSAYAQYSTGFRAGYGNSADTVGPQETTLGSIVVPRNVDPEFMKSYEVGLKGRFFDRRLSLTTAVFYMDYEDLQVYGEIPPDFRAFSINTGQAQIQGAELEGAWRVTDRLELRTAIGYVDPQIQELPFGETVLRDVDIPNVRPWNGSVTGIYEFEVRPGTTTQLRADYVRQGRMYNDFDRDRANEMPQFDTLDLSLGLTRGAWNFTAYIENALDETYWIGSGGYLGVRGNNAHFLARTFGLRATYTYEDR